MGQLKCNDTCLAPGSEEFLKIDGFVLHSELPPKTHWQRTLPDTKTPLDRKGAASIKCGVLTLGRNPDWSGSPDSNRRFQLVRYYAEMVISRRPYKRPEKTPSSDPMAVTRADGLP